MPHQPASDPDSPEYANDDPTWGELSPQDDARITREMEDYVPPYTGRVIIVRHRALMTEDYAEIETLEPHAGDNYIVGVRGYCGSMHHMVATARDLAPLIAW